LIRFYINLYFAYVLFSWFCFVRAGKYNLVNIGREIVIGGLELPNVIQGIEVQDHTQDATPPQPLQDSYEEQSPKQRDQ